MKRFQSLISERTKTAGDQQAEALGLKYKGYGFYVDPATGKVTHKVKDGKLEEVDDTELATAAVNASPGGGGGLPGMPGEDQNPGMGPTGALGHLKTEAPGHSFILKNEAAPPPTGVYACIYACLYVCRLVGNVKVMYVYIYVNM